MRGFQSLPIKLRAEVFCIIDILIDSPSGYYQQVNKLVLSSYHSVNRSIRIGSIILASQRQYLN
jgi:hypothetical protein